MAIFATGWESGDRTFYIQQGWTFSVAGVGPTTAARHRSALGHGGDYSVTIGGGGNALSPTFSTTARWAHARFGTTDFDSRTMAFTFRRSGTDTWSVVIDSSGFVVLRRGGVAATQVQTDVFTNPGVNGDVWVAVQLLAADAGGVCEVWINGVMVSTFSGDTKNAGTADWDQMRFTGGGGGGTVYVDDIVITTDAEGRLTERFLPALRPDGNDAVQFTPVGSVNNWENVDEVPTSTADYNGETTSGEQDTYTLANLPWTVPSSGVHAVVVWAYCNAQDGSLTQAELITKPTTTSFYASAVVLPASPTFGVLTDVRNTNPDTSAAWTPSEVDALKVGVRFTT